MKKMLFCSVMIFLQTFAGDSAELSIDKITFNKSEFINDFAIAKRGLIGCLCEACPSLRESMTREDLKKKYLLYDGAPLSSRPNADELLDAFLDKNNLATYPCPRYRGEIAVNQAQKGAAQVEMCLSRPGFLLGCISLGLGCGATAYFHNCQGMLIGLLSCLGVGVPILDSTNESFMLQEWASRNGKLSAGPRSLDMSDDTVKKDD